MAGQKKISALTTTTELGDTDLIAIVQDGVTKALPGGFINSAIQDAKDHAEEILENFEPESFPNIVDFFKPSSDFINSLQQGNSGNYNSDKQIVSLPSGYDYTHGSVIVGDFVFFGCRVPSGQPARIIKMSLSDINNYQTLVLSSGNYSSAEQLTYVKSKSKIYIAHHGNGGNDVHISELDPDTFTVTNIIHDLAIGYKNYYPTTATDGTWLYFSSGQQTAGTNLKIRRYNLNTLSFDSELDTGLIGGGHSFRYDGYGNLFLSTTYRATPIQQYIVKIRVSDFTLVTSLSIGGESYTDDMAICGDYIYLGQEYVYTTSSTFTITRVKKDLSGVEYIKFPSIIGTSYGVVYDEKYLWFLAATNPGTIIRVDPETYLTSIYTTPTGEENPNEYLTDGKNYIFSFWKTPSVIVKYNKIQFQKFGILKKGSDYVYTEFEKSLNPTALKISDYNVVDGDLVLVSTSGGDVIINLPQYPTDKFKFGVKYLSKTGNNKVYILTYGGASYRFEVYPSGASSYTLESELQYTVFQFDTIKQVFFVTVESFRLSDLDLRYKLVSIASNQSGDGVSTVFNIPHGLAYTPVVCSVVAGSSNASGFTYATSDSTNIIIHYTVPPDSGSNNLSWNILIK